MSRSTFGGFSHEGLQFLVDLALNNDRSWFQPRKARYERLLKEPLAALCEAVGAEFLARGVPLVADPQRSPFRIYRDVRFSRDKSPYKTAVSARFPCAGPGGGVGGYFHLEPGNVYLGGGMWHPAPARLRAWRQLVVDERERVKAALEGAAFRSAFGRPDGDRVSRMPVGFAADDPDADLIRLKDVTFGRRLTDDDARSGDLPTIIATDLAAAVPFLGLLAALPGVEEPPSLGARPGSR